MTPASAAAPTDALSPRSTQHRIASLDIVANCHAYVAVNTCTMWLWEATSHGTTSTRIVHETYECQSSPSVELQWLTQNVSKGSRCKWDRSKRRDMERKEKLEGEKGDGGKGKEREETEWEEAWGRKWGKKKTEAGKTGPATCCPKRAPVSLRSVAGPVLRWAVRSTCLAAVQLNYRWRSVSARPVVVAARSSPVADRRSAAATDADPDAAPTPTSIYARRHYIIYKMDSQIYYYN